MPINLLDAHYRIYQKEVVPVCNDWKIGAIGMKALAGGLIPKKLGIGAERCRRFALSQPITSLVCGIQSREDLRQDIEIARTFKPVSEGEMEQLLAQTEEAGSDGKMEPWETTETAFLRGGDLHEAFHRAFSDPKPEMGDLELIRLVALDVGETRV